MPEKPAHSDSDEALWARVLQAVAQQIDPATFETWFRPVVFAGWDQTSCTLSVPSPSFRRCFLDNFSTLLRQTIESLLQAPVQLHVSAVETQASTGGTTLPVARASELESETTRKLWLIERLWTSGGVGILAGQPKSLKTYVALEMAVSVASGSPCLGTFPVSLQGPALVYAAEDSLSNLRSRLAALAAQRGLGLEDLDLQVITADFIRLDHPQDQERLRETVLLYRPALLVLDPLVRLHSQDENQSGPMASLLGYLRQLQRSTGTAVLVVHHVRKNGNTAGTGYNLRGSSDLYAWVDSYVCLQRRRDRIAISAEHRTAAPLSPLPIELVPTPDNARAPGLRISPQDIELTEPDHDALRTRLLDLLANAAHPFKTEEIRQKLQVRKQRVTKMLRELCEEGSAARLADGYCALLRPPREGPCSAL
jgi:hypothetical protein